MQPPAQPGPPQAVLGYGQPQYQQQPYPGYPMQPVWQQPMAVPAPVMIDGYLIVQPRLKPILSGPAIGSLVAGIGGILGAVVQMIAAALNPWAGLAFFMFTVLVGVGSVGLAVYARRQIRGSQGGVSGRGVALTGLILGIVACSLAGMTGLIALLVA